MEPIKYSGILPDMVVFNSEGRFRSFLYIVESEAIENVILPTLLYELLEKRNIGRLFMLLKGYEWTLNREALKTWLVELPSNWATVRDRFTPYKEISGHIEEVLSKQVELRKHLEMLHEKARKFGDLGEVFYEMAETSLIMDYPILSFTRHFRRVLRQLEIPSFEVVTPCTEHLKRLHETKKRYFLQMKEFKMVVKGRKVPIGKIFLFSMKAVSARIFSPLEPLDWIPEEAVFALIQNGI